MDITKKKPVEVVLGDKTVLLDYTLASLHYLTSKHGDLTLFLQKATGRGTGEEGKAKKVSFTSEFIGALADLIYAGLYVPDDDGNDTSGWSPMKVMSKIHPSDLEGITAAVGTAFDNGAPTGKTVDP